jgi:hypothetical protein
MDARIKAALLITALVAIFAFSYPAVSITPDGVAITNGDSVRQEMATASVDLGFKLSGMTGRVVIEFANSMRDLVMSGPAPDLEGRLEQVGPRPLMESAETTRLHAIMAPAGAWAAQLGAVTQRIQLRFAERNVDRVLQYPGDLLQDHEPPQIGRPTSSGAHVEWTTNEFTTSVVRYGPSNDDLSQLVIDTTLQKRHVVMLAGMGPNTILYCQITSTDQSGNVATSDVYQVSGPHYLYMPSLKR